ncbi:MAG: ABC transporter ATP-binding protein [Verrucomicrobia bacterium]|nr:ABC transporter ATP-binding protein [Verrucomicrobiota bacterium]
MSTPAVQIENISKFFPVPLRRQRVQAVKNLSLVVEPGQVYGLLGPNGCGKSTTLKILLGLVTPNSGRALVFGKDSREYRSRRDVGFLPENPYFHKFLTAAELLSFHGRICGLSGKKLTARIDELIDLVGLRDARDRRVGGFSKGMLQRIGLAQALVHDPGLIVLDEPTAGVDPAGSHQIRDLILDLKKRGKTVLLTSHLLEQVQEICDRVGIMARGEMIREGALKDLVRVKNQTEFVIENSTPELAAQIQNLVAASSASLIATRQPERSLETVFLELTAGDR